MTLKLFNTLGRKLELFKPIKGKKVNFFVCGPTVYDYSHLGHAKTYTQFDFIVRFLRKSGFDIFYLQNITDMDDKIINRAKEKKLTPKQLTEEFEKIYMEDMKSLHNTSVTKYARATDYIPQIVKQVNQLVKKGYAYKISDGYYFDLKKFPDYGKLSGRTILQDEDAVSRIDENEEKRNNGDFCLWKLYKEGEPSWETELGKGRPGWHIEDTAITESFFGPQYDVHGGAVDLIFPHHEAEIAQIEAASGKKPLVRYWMHTGFLNINSEKMSKSKGNFFTIREALKNHDYRTLRYFFLSNHYRMPLNYAPEFLDQAKHSLQRIDDFIFSIDRKKDDKENTKRIEKTRTSIINSLNEDINTPIALASLFKFIRDINKEGNSGKHVLSFMKELNELFDFMNFEAEEIPKEIKELISKRDEARKRKDFKKADELRNEIRSKGYLIDDSEHGLLVKKA
ncbi:TPA: cysteine--tRNA ligase [Candidatus Woesearchaeota archaeon]|nr:cysteine--tRNA ligase [Candidatus Woesearchaeota archaeon]HIH39933.1 cysteine--tRNA ligase [Candidatus Woesearchaeota archaeon]